MTFENLPELLTINQIAAYLKVSLWTMHKLDKVLKPIRIGKRHDRRYSKQSLADFLEKGYTQ